MGNREITQHENTYKAKLERAIGRVEKEKNVNYWDEVVKKSLTKDKIMVAVMKKLVADKKEVELTGEDKTPIKIKVEVVDERDKQDNTSGSE